MTSFQRKVVAANCNGPIDAPDSGNSIVQTSVRQAKDDVQMPKSNFAKYSKIFFQSNYPRMKVYMFIGSYYIRLRKVKIININNLRSP